MDAASKNPQKLSKLTVAQRDEVIDELMDSVNNPDVSSSAKMDNLITMQSMIAPMLIKEISKKNPKLSTSVIASRATSSIKELGALIKTKTEVESFSEVNPYSPKFQTVFGWFLELQNDVLDAMVDEKVLSKIDKAIFSQAFSQSLIGWEGQVEHNLKGISTKALASLSNPFLDDMKKEQNSALPESSKDS